MKAKDIMTTPVVTIEPDTTVREIAALLLERRISGVPVVEAGRLVGLVSEGDLLHRHEIGTDRDRPTRSWWLSLIDGDPCPAEYVKSHARRARDIMTRDVISVAEDAPIAEIATVLETHRIKRVPVLRGEQLVGVVSRANLVQALAAHRAPARRRVRRATADPATAARGTGAPAVVAEERVQRDRDRRHRALLGDRRLRRSERKRRASPRRTCPACVGVEDSRTHWAAWQGMY